MPVLGILSYPAFELTTVKYSVLFLIAFASVGFAGMMPPDLSDPPPGPLQFFQQTEWVQVSAASETLIDYSLQGSPAALRAIRNTEAPDPNGTTLLTGDSVQDVATRFPDSRVTLDDPSFRRLSGLAFSLD